MVLPLFSVLLLISCTNVNTALTKTSDTRLFLDSSNSIDTSLLKEQVEREPTIVRYRYAQLNFDLLTGQHITEDADSIILNLFHDTTFTAVKDRVEKRSTARYTWFGRISEIKYSRVILTVENGSMAGNITLPSDSYQIRDTGKGIHAVYEINQNAFHNEATPD